MKLLIVVMTALFMVHLLMFHTAAKEWRGIVPLHSTRQDLERLIGPKKIRCSNQACLYDLGEETVFALFAAEQTCKNDDATTAWRVPSDTVIEITVRFKTERQLFDLGFDLTKFKRTINKELPGLVYYNNQEDGVEIEASDKTARSISYYQTAKDNYLRCPKQAQP